MGGLIQKLVFKSGSEGISQNVSKSFFDFKVKDLLGNEYDFSQLKSKKLTMIVNVACK